MYMFLVCRVMTLHFQLSILLPVKCISHKVDLSSDAVAALCSPVFTCVFISLSHSLRPMDKSSTISSSRLCPGSTACTRSSVPTSSLIRPTTRTSPTTLWTGSAPDRYKHTQTCFLSVQKAVSQVEKHLTCHFVQAAPYITFLVSVALFLRV